MKQFADAANEYGDVITSSPASMPAEMQSRCRPDVPDETAAAYGAPTFAANASSKRSIVGPSESRPERSTSRTSSSSRASMYGPESGTGRPHLLGHACVLAAGAYSSHCDQRSLRPCTVSRYACWISTVTGPGRPMT